MSSKKLITWQAILLLLGIALILWGIWGKEAAALARHGSYICLECIGLG